MNTPLTTLRDAQLLATVLTAIDHGHALTWIGIYSGPGGDGPVRGFVTADGQPLHDSASLHDAHLLVGMTTHPLSRILTALTAGHATFTTPDTLF